jgi:HEAT repeat protein
MEDIFVPPTVLCGEEWTNQIAADGRYATQKGADFVRTDVMEPVTDLFVEHPYLVVLGGPGSGKTTFLNYLAVTFARAYLEGDTRPLRDRLGGFDQPLLPIYVPVKIFSAQIFERDAEKTLHLAPEIFFDLFTSHLLKSDITLSQERLIREVGNGQCLFLFDGMDEAGAVSQCAYLAQTISSLRNAHPENRFVVTSRQHGYQALSGPFRTCEIQEMGERQKRVFIHRWSRAVIRARTGQRHPLDLEHKTREHTERLIAGIETNPSARALSTNRLLLMAIAVVYEFEAKIIRHRVDLYQECTDLLVGGRDIANILMGKPVPAPFEVDIEQALERKECLERVGLWFQEHIGRESISQAELADLLQDMYTSRDVDPELARIVVANVIRFFCERGGILEERQFGAFSFSLRVFQEYLAARAVVSDCPDPIGYLIPHARDRRWRQVIRLAAGHWSGINALGAAWLVRALLTSIEQADEAVRNIERITHDTLLLAAECLIEIGIMSDPNLCQEVITRLVRAFESARVHRLRGEIAEKLGKLPKGIAGRTLYDWLSSDDDQVVASALRGFIYLPVEWISTKIADDLLTFAIEKRNADRAPEGKWTDQETRLHREIEQYIVLTLERIAGMPGQIGRGLVNRLADDVESDDDAQRQIAAQVLSRTITGSKREFDLVRKLIWPPADRQAVDRQVRWICSRGLLSRGVGSGRPASLADLLKMLEDEDWGIRGEAARTAGTLERALVTNKLLNRLLYHALWDDEREVLSAASASLGRIASQRFCSRNRSKILSAMQDDREEVRAAAARLFGRLGQRALNDQVKMALINGVVADPSDQVGYAAAKALSRIGPSAIQVGQRNSHKTSIDLLDAACGRAYRDARGAPRLGLYTRSALCKTVTRVGRMLEPRTITESFIKHIVLTDPIPELRAAAVLAVEELGFEMIRDPELVEALVRTIQQRMNADAPEDMAKTESDSTVRASILRILAQDPLIHENERLRYLIRLCAKRDESTAVRVAALQILGRTYTSSLDSADRDTLLFSCTHDPSLVVRSSAYNALMRLESPVQEEQIVGVLDSTKARRATIRVHLEQLLIEGGALSPAEATNVIQEITASLRLNFQLESRVSDKPAEELQAWVQATDYGLTRMQLETHFERAIEKYVPSRGQKRARARLMCGDLVQGAILDHFYVRPKPVGDTLRRNQDWKQARDEINAFCGYFGQEYMIGTDYAAAESRLKNALACLNRLVTQSPDKYPCSYQAPAQRADLATLPRVRDKVRRLCEELDGAEPSPHLARYLLEQIRRTPSWSDL